MKRAMDERIDLERIRAWASGEMPEAERAALEQELEGDPELRAFAREYRAVHALTALAGDVPACDVRFEDLELAPPPRRRRAAALALAALAAGALLLVGLRLLAGSAPESVELRTIPLAGGAEETGAPGIPAQLASYRPVEDGRIRWVRDLAVAGEISAAVDRPVLLFVRWNSCPIAEHLRRTSLADDAVIALAEDCVPCELDILSFPEEEQAAMLAQGYPFFELREGSRSLASLTGDYLSADGPAEFRRRLQEGLAGRAPASVPWSVARDLADLDVRAADAEEAGDLARARRLYEELAAGGAGEFAAAGRAGLRRIALGARDALLAARARSEDDRDGAERLLAEALRRFEGTPHAGDLARVLEALRGAGRFPVLVFEDGVLPAHAGG